MQKQTKIIGSLIILLVVGFLGWYTINKINKKSPPVNTLGSDVTVIGKNPEGKPYMQINKNDPDCTKNYVESAEDQNFEYIYYGNIKEGQPIQIILSCDQERFTITGAVNQIIDTNDKKMFPDLDMFNALADIANSSGVVYLEDDYNFDGYNDLHTISSNGQGWDGVDSVNIFLYDPVTQKFVFNTELSKLQNVLPPDYENKFIFEDFSYYLKDEHVEVYRKHKWFNGHLIKIEE